MKKRKAKKKELENRHVGMSCKLENTVNICECSVFEVLKGKKAVILFNSESKEVLGKRKIKYKDFNEYKGLLIIKDWKEIIDKKKQQWKKKLKK
jgi:hypothetical protein